MYLLLMFKLWTITGDITPFGANIEYTHRNTSIQD